MFYKTGVIAGQIIFDPFPPVTLTLTMTYIYKLDPHFLELYRMCEYELPTSRLSKVIV